MASQVGEAHDILALKEEISRLLAETTSSSAAATAAEAALLLQIETAAKREKNATSDCASRVAELTTTLVGRELSAMPSVSEGNGFLPLEGKAALADSYNKLQAETARLRDEESERQARIAAMEQALKASEERIKSHQARFESLVGNLRALQDALQKKEMQERSTLQALEAERNDARRVIGEHSDTYAQRLLSVWDSEGAQAAASVAAEFEPQLLALAREAEAELSESTALVRSVARQLAQYLTGFSGADELLALALSNAAPTADQLQQTSANRPHHQQMVAAVLRLESQRANHAKVAPRLLAIRAQCLRALDDLRQGRGGVSKLMTAANEAEAEATDFRPLVSPFPLLAEAAATNASPLAGVQHSGRVAPAHDVYSKLEQQDAASLGMSPVEAKLELARLTESVVTRLMAGAELAHTSPAAAFEDKAEEEEAAGDESQNGHQLALHKMAQPHEAAAADEAAAAATRDGLASISEALRDSQQAVTAVSRPPLPIAVAAAAGPSTLSPSGRRMAGHQQHQLHSEVVRGDLGREYRLESERLDAREKIQQAEAALVELLRERHVAEAALVASRSKRESSAEVASALEAARRHIVKGGRDIDELRDWIARATAAYREQFGSYDGNNGNNGEGDEALVGLEGDDSSGGSFSSSAASTLRTLLGHAANGDGSSGGSGGHRAEDEPPMVVVPKVSLSLSTPLVTVSLHQQPQALSPSSSPPAKRLSAATAASASSSSTSIKSELMASMLVKPKASKQASPSTSSPSGAADPSSASTQQPEQQDVSAAGSVAASSVARRKSPSGDSKTKRTSGHSSVASGPTAVATTVAAMLANGGMSGSARTSMSTATPALTASARKAPATGSKSNSRGPRSSAGDNQSAIARSAFGVDSRSRAGGFQPEQEDDDRDHDDLASRAGGGGGMEDLITAMSSVRSQQQQPYRASSSRRSSVALSVTPSSPVFGGASGSGGSVLGLSSAPTPGSGSARRGRIRAGSLIGSRGGRLYTPTTSELNDPAATGSAASPIGVGPSPRLSSASPRFSTSPRTGGPRASVNAAKLADLLRGAL